MNLRGFLKTLVVTPTLLLLPKSQPSWRLVETDKGTLDLYKPYECDIHTVFGKDYNIKVVLTKDIVIEMPDKTIELNVYGEYVKILASCRIGPINGGPKITHIKRYESKLLLDGKVTREDYNQFIVRVQGHFEKEIYTDYLWSDTTQKHLTKITI